MVIGAKSGAAMGPIPAEARRQEGLRLERPGASPLDEAHWAAAGIASGDWDSAAWPCSGWLFWDGLVCGLRSLAPARRVRDPAGTGGLCQ